MPAKRLMSWDPKARRWWKQYRKKRYHRSCRQLGKWVGHPVSETMEGSYQVANAWWLQKKAEIDGEQPPHPHAAGIEDYRRKRDWYREHNQQDVARFFDAEARRMEKFPDDPSNYEMNRRFQVIQRLHAAGLQSPDEITEQMMRHLSFDDIWEERLLRQQSKPIPEDLSMEFLVKSWLSLMRVKVQTEDLSAEGLDNLEDYLNPFRDWLGPQVTATVINPASWENYFTFVSGEVAKGTWSREYAAKVFATARRFIMWLVSKDVIAAPNNLRNADYRFRVSARTVETMTPQEVREIVGHATGQLKLHLLLMANCGMTQKDVSDLRQVEVDWDDGRIIRKRSKTKKEKRVPTVNYKLWPLTFDLLKQFRSKDPEFVLLTRTGKRWVYGKLNEKNPEKLKSSDSIATNYNRLRKRLAKQGVTIKTLKVFRKTSATLLYNNNNFSRFAEHFLSHAPRYMMEKHYLATFESEFDPAVLWLGREYGFISG